MALIAIGGTVVVILTALLLLRPQQTIAVVLTWYSDLVTLRGQRLDGPTWQWANGQMPEKFLFGKEKSHEWQRHGSVYRIWAGVTPEIVITTPQHVRVFHTENQQHYKAPASNAGWVFHDLLGDCVGLINGPRWRDLRTPLEKAFTRESTRTRLAQMNVAVRKHMERLRVESGKSDDGTVRHLSVVQAFQKFPFFHTAKIIYGPLSDAEQDELWQLGLRRQALLRFAIMGNAYRYKVFRRFAQDAAAEVNAFHSAWDLFNDKIFDQRSDKMGGGLIESLWPAIRSGQLSKKEVLQTFDEMLFANLDVTTHVISWIFTLIADNEGVQQKLRTEIDGNYGGLNSYLQKDDTYLHRCFLESLRLRPVSAFTIPESSKSDKVFDGTLVPAEVDVVVDAIAVNIRNPFWGKDSTSFRPERFDGVSNTDLRYNLAAFGFGARKCLGQYEATILIKALVVETIKAFKMSIFDAEGKSKHGFQIVKDNWVPLADVKLAFEDSL